jgi:FKBP-type peptidyl-prolyl isomerase-like protein
LPQSRKRQMGKRKGRRGLYAQTQHAPRSANRSTRIIAGSLIVALGLAGLTYYFLRDGGTSGEVTTASGLRYVELQEGTGPTPQTGQRVAVHYTGTLESGTKFDSSRDPGKKPLEFVIGGPGMIKGFDEGVRSMKVGGKRKLIVPPRIGYGSAGNPPTVPPNATLVFEVELLSIK